MKKIKIQVPATTANLGPGFDCFGMAFELYNTFEFELTDGEYRFAGFEAAYANEENYIVKAFKHALELCPEAVENAVNLELAEKLENPALSITLLAQEVPICRGLGSSSTLYLAGVEAFNALFDAGLSKAEVLKLATDLEGHPDNLAPAIFGGLTVSAMDDGVIVTERFEPAENLRFIVAIPDFELSTALSRSVLPAKLDRADAIYSVSHAALLIRALETGDLRRIAFAQRDKIHQPYRKPLITDYEKVEKEMLDLGLASVVISGAGPTILGIGDKNVSKELSERLEKISDVSWQVMCLKPDSLGARTEVLE